VRPIPRDPEAPRDETFDLPEKILCSSTDRMVSIGMESDASDGQGRIMVFFQGHIDEEILARAVDLTMRAEPILTYRFVNHPWRPYWQRTAQVEQKCHFKVMEGTSSDKEFSDFMARPLSPTQAPQIRVRVFRSDNDVLCIRLNHMIMDGGGAIAYLSMLSSLYRELERDPEYLPTVNLERMQIPREVLRRGGLLPAIRGLPSIQVPGSTWGINREGGDCSGRAFITRTILPDRLAAIRSYAREEGVTINDVLLTALYRSLFVLVDPPMGQPLRAEVPINLRRYLPDGKRAIGNVAGIYFITIDRRDGEDFKGTLQRVHGILEKKKERQEELAEMLFIELVLFPGMFLIEGLAKFTNFQIAHPVLSNLGIIDPKVVDFGNVPVEDVHFFGPVQLPPGVGMGASTFHQRMTLSFSYCDTAVRPSTMEQLFDLILEELPGRMPC